MDLLDMLNVCFGCNFRVFFVGLVSFEFLLIGFEGGEFI